MASPGGFVFLRGKDGLLWLGHEMRKYDLDSVFMEHILYPLVQPRETEDILQQEGVTLAEGLKEAGYSTGFSSTSGLTIPISPSKHQST